MVKQQKYHQQNLANPVFTLKPLAACIKMIVASGLFLGNTPAHAASPASVLPVPSKTWVKSGSVGPLKINGSTMTIKQKSDKAVLHWDKFDVGAKNTVKFEQPKSTSIALNKIFQKDNASRILGNISANGQVYLYNSNGFIFGKNSTVNANTLVASALSISDDVFNNNGITKHFNKTGGAALGSDEAEGNPDPARSMIEVQPGANLKVGKNGRIILAAPTVTNQGNLEADNNGQIIMVASKDKVYLAENNAKESIVNTDFSGLLVEVGSGGRVDNLGNVLARQGNVTLAGFAVNQKGRVTATTSARVNGSIRLMARQGLGADSTGNTLNPLETVNAEGNTAKLTFAKGSTTEIIADTKDATAIDEQKQPQSALYASAHTVHFQSGSKIHLPGGKVEVAASNNPFQPDTPLAGPLGRDIKRGRILIDSGVKIDVSGSKTIKASVTRNVVDVPVQSYELRNSPRQKGGVLQGKTVRVDIRDKTPILDTGGAEKRVERGIDERLGNGGVINLTSAGDIHVSPKAVFDISGGTVNYQGGYINTSKLLTDYGTVINISAADPNQHYRSLLGTYEEIHPKWGVTKVWQNAGLYGRGRYEAGYLEGLDAGALHISTPEMSWNGSLIAGSNSGFFQRNPQDRAFGGLFEVDSATYLAELLQSDNTLTKQNLVLQKNKGLFIAAGRPSQTTSLNSSHDLVISTDGLNQSGIQDVHIKSLGNALIGEDATIAFPSGKTKGDHTSQFHLTAGNIDVKGDINLPGGNVKLHSGNNDGDISKFPGALGKITLAPSSKLNVSGRWVNDFALGLTAVPTEGLAINGGGIELFAAGDMTLQSGSVLHADGGAWLAQDEKLSEGKAGNIVLRAITPASEQKPAMKLDATLTAYGLSNGGKLTLQHPGNIVIGAQALTTASDNSVLSLPVKNGRLAFPGTSGFDQFELLSGLDMQLKSNTNLNLIQKNPVLAGGYRQHASRDRITGLSTLTTLPDYLRKPVDLTLSSDASLKLETGSNIRGDNRSAITLKSTGKTLGSSIYADGSVSAPAGKINLDLTFNAGSEVEYDPRQAVWLGKHAKLEAKGVSVLNPPDALGRRSGEVLEGGEVNLYTDFGYLIMEKGAMIDVSGARAKLDLLTDDPAGIQTQPTDIGSNAGKIKLTATEGMSLDGNLLAASGTKSVKGGELAIDFNRNVRPSLPLEVIPRPFGPSGVTIRQDYKQQLTTVAKNGDPLDTAALGLLGNAVISSQQLRSGQFEDVQVKVANGAASSDGISYEASINFQGDVKLVIPGSITLDAPLINWQGSANSGQSSVNVNTGYLKFANSSGADLTAEPAVSGQAIVSATSKWLELNGRSKWNAVKQASLKASHDIRASIEGNDATGTTEGKLLTAGNLNLTASQIYPSTLAKFTFAVDNTVNPTGQITLSKNGTAQSISPLSAGGELTFEAANIVQNGIVKAPFGKLNLTASQSITFGKDSITSVSGAGQLIPFGTLRAGQNWVYGETVKPVPPEKKLTLSAPAVSLAKGSTVDLSGGGDLYAYEFQPGIGGSSDYLGDFSPTDGPTNYAGGFAILPRLGSALAPYDPLQAQLNNYKHPVGSQVYLNKSSKLAADFYTVLPARYALLPGAFLITPQSNSTDQRLTTFNTEGLPVVGGYQRFAGSGKQNARWSAYLVEDGADIRKHSQYQEVTANKFYVQRAARKETPVPILPKDSGQLVIKNASTQLGLDGNLSVASDGGRGARLDIAANRLNIVDKLSALPPIDTLEVLATSLTQLNVGSLLLGGERSNNIETGITDLQVTSDEVSFDKGVNLAVSDLIATAKNKVTVKSGAKLTAQGKVTTGDKQLRIAGNEDGSSTGDGALIRLSSDQQVSLTRVNAPRNTGELFIEQGSSLGANTSMLLDVSLNTAIAGDLLMQGGSLNLSANQINLGQVDGLSASNALNLSNNDLAKLTVDELILKSRESLNFYGNVGITNKTGVLEPLSVERLVLDAPGLSGFGSNRQTASLKADNLLVRNSTNKASETKGTGKGQLLLTANNYQQGGGALAISGFNAVNVDVAHGFNVTANSKLAVNADLKLTARYLSTKSGRQLELNAAGYQAAFTGQADELLPKITDFAGAIKVVADYINFNTAAIMPSGKLELHALTGNILVGSQAIIDLAGQAVKFVDTLDYTPGGIFKAEADQGQIVVAARLPSDKKRLEIPTINVSSGGGKAKGGLLDLSAVEQNSVLSGEISAKGGSAKLDVSGFSKSQNFDEQMASLNKAGVTESVWVRSRQDSLVQAKDHRIVASDISLSSDQGEIRLAGELNANNPNKGGNIMLAAGDKITLSQDAKVIAKGEGNNAKGGKVLLVSTDADNDRKHGIGLNKGSTIDVGGRSLAQGGSVVLRALRTGNASSGTNNNVAIDTIAGEVRGAAEFYADAIKQYDNKVLGNDQAVNTADIATLNTETKNYMAAAQQVSKRLGQGIQLRPGIEINTTGDLTLADEWNLADWRYREFSTKTALPGFLGIHTTGNLKFENSLTDGFKTEQISHQVAYFNPDGTVANEDDGFTPKTLTVIKDRDILRSDDSWSYQLTAGVDNNAADKTLTATDKNIILALKTKAKTIDPFNQNLNLLTTVVRTGTGDITASAGGDIVFGGGRLIDANGTAILDPTIIGVSADPISGALLKPLNFNTVLYTAGKAMGANRYGSFSDEFVKANYGFSVAQGVDGLSIPYAIGEYPLAGGDLILSAGHDIVGVPSQSGFQNLDSPWLVKQGRISNPTTGETAIPTAWGIDFAKFSENVGSFGEGNTRIEAGNNINDLGLAVPTTGKAVGNNVFDPNSITFTAVDNKLLINGKGQLQVAAGGNIAGGVFYIGEGNAEITAKGAITGSSSQKDEQNLGVIANLTRGSQILMGNAEVNLTAHKGISLSAVTDPMILGKNAAFFSYGPSSSIQLKNLSGNINLAADTAVVGAGAASTTFQNYYPGTLMSTSFAGNTLLDGFTTFFPANTGDLTILSSGKIASLLDTNPIIWTVSDAGTEALPTAQNPNNPSSLAEPNLDKVHALSPVHRADQNPVRLITQQGNIENMTFDLAKKVLISSGRDLKNMTVTIQHANPDGDVSVISAARDISYPIPDTAALAADPNAITVAGTGDVLVQAGRNVDLGTSVGIATLGNGPNLDNSKANPNLSPFGANLTVVAGLNGKSPNYLGFEKLDAEILDYAENYSKYQALVTDFMRQRTGNTKLATKTAFEQFRQLAPSQVTGLTPKFAALKSQKYKAIIKAIKQDIAEFVRLQRNNPGLSEAKAVELFNAFTSSEITPIQTRLNALANEILFTELNQTGADSAADPLAGNERGYKAINALYPGKNWNGDLSLVFSSLQTMKGGNMNVLVPGGNVNVGLPIAGFSKEEKGDDKLGIIARGKGDVNVFSDGNFDVNQSRVFAQGGGDISVWSSFGNIDAGRGAKSALAVSDPVYGFDENGNLTVDFPPPIAGSGIRTVDKGNVGLFAPGGVVDAGEAGIGGNNVTISAVAVLGANNIDVGGVSTGVPATSTVSLAAGLTGVGNAAANATKMAEASASMDKNRQSEDEANKKNQLGTIKVELIGFGA